MFGHSKNKAAGHITISSSDGTQEFETRQCIHCGKHWVYVPGSGTERGWCMRCHGLTCGAQKCKNCVPYEAQIEIMEGAKEVTARRYLDDYRTMEWDRDKA